MPIHNQKKAMILAEAITTVRSDRNNGTPDWHPTATFNVLRDNWKCPAPYIDIFIALLQYANQSDKRVPTFMFDALKDWAPPGDPRVRNPCEDHGFPAHNCHSCKADILVGDRPPEFMGKHYEIPTTGLD